MAQSRGPSSVYNTRGSNNYFCRPLLCMLSLTCMSASGHLHTSRVRLHSVSSASSFWYFRNFWTLFYSSDSNIWYLRTTAYYCVRHRQRYQAWPSHTNRLLIILSEGHCLDVSARSTLKVLHGQTCMTVAASGWLPVLLLWLFAPANSLWPKGSSIFERNLKILFKIVLLLEIMSIVICQFSINLWAFLSFFLKKN